MNIAIVHYHLKPGGVTRVVENAVASLSAFDCDIVSISGEPYKGGALEKTAVVSDLAYTQPHEKPEPKALLASLKEAARSSLGAEPDVWHIHNHSLGKNNAMPDVVTLLAKEGASILLQIHDFAEDGRPQNYETLTKHLSDECSLYPSSSRIHYAVLNARDCTFFKSVGIDDARLHILPNPIALPELSETSSKIEGIEADELILYPTRAIRRKNMGEFVLASAVSEKGQAFASTLAPANPTALPIYEQWVSCATAHQLPIHFAIGEQSSLSFSQIVSAAQKVMTTSVAEGFGLAFLEPFLFNKPLCGRDIPDITADFKNEGIDLSELYTSVEVPLEWVGDADLKSKLGKALDASYAAYKRPLPQDAVEQCMAAICQNGCVDFGRLDEALQQKVIQHVVDSPESQESIRAQLYPGEGSASIQSQNKTQILKQYSLDSYGKQLFSIYEDLIIAPSEQIVSLNAIRLLECFLEPSRFFLLRS